MLPLIPTLVALLLCAAPAPAGAATVPPDWAGANAYWVFASLPRSSWDRQVDAMAAAGVRVARLDASWNVIEPTAPVNGVHTYNWMTYDDIVATLAKRGIRWYPVIDYSAPWAGDAAGQWRTPPRNASDFATYAAALAKRYGAGGAFWKAHPELPQVPVREWEVWNEENGSYFWPSAPDAARYADLYIATRNALRAVDPGARAVVGGLIGKGAGYFLRDMVAARPGMAIDAVGLHAYGATVSAAAMWWEDVRNWLTYLGYGSTPIEITEFGWTTVGSLNVATDALRAIGINDLMRRAAATPGISRMIVYAWTTKEQSLTNGEDWYGIYAPDGTPHASGTAFSGIVRDLTGLLSTTTTAVTTTTSKLLRPKKRTP